MKTLQNRNINQEWLDEENRSINRLCSNSRSKDQLASLHSLLIGGNEFSDDLDLGDLIAEVECLMLINNEAEWVMVDRRRHFKASPRVIAWALTVIEKKSEDLFIRISSDFAKIDPKTGLPKIQEWEYWKRISLEFDAKEYKALIKILENILSTNLSWV